MRTTSCLAALCALALVAVPLTASGRQSSINQFIDAERLEAAYTRVGLSIRTLPRRFSLARLLQQAMSVSDAGNASPVERNRAALVVIAAYVNDWSLGGLVPAARDWPRLPNRVVLLQGREDLAQHFMLSASLTATAGSPLADTVALLKEMKDASRGSGFSFSDVAAHRAGTRFGQLATESPGTALELVARLAEPLVDDDIMPGTRGLPDNLRDAEFKRRIGEVGSPMYNALVSDIDRRIAALDLYRPNAN